MSQIFNPGGLGGHELSQSFCGTCHTSFYGNALPGQSGINNIRFQPYRIFNSRGTTPTIRASDALPVTIHTTSSRKTPPITTRSVSHVI